MIRVVALAIGLLLVVWLVLKVLKAAREARIDWTGIAFGLGFVALAFYLRGVTGIG